ncbi:phosphoglycerate kinase [bacterium]|nr:phosphoglycerate kinase [bacterium]
MSKITIDDLDPAGKRVILRVDFNVPLSEGKVADDTRIRKSLPTIKAVLKRGGMPVIISHIGRPKGKIVSELSLTPVASHLEKLIGYPVSFISDYLDGEIRFKKESIVMLENIRFHPGEERNDKRFAKKLSRLGDSYINDAFGVVHRKHASVVALPELFDQPAAGYLLIEEVKNLSHLLSAPEHPFLAIIGGAKVSSKIGAINSLLDKSDTVFIGGLMACAFFRALGVDVGKTPVDEKSVELASEIIKQEKLFEKKLLLPVDSVASSEKPETAEPITVNWDSMPRDAAIYDIGPSTIEMLSSEISRAKTIFANGPVGLFEIEKFSVGTREVLLAIAERTKTGAFTVIAGGDTLAAMNRLGISEESFSHVSTGGGASLEFIGGAKLPGLEVLPEK